jgi:alkanesulfonate monooxygenase SsuD/methylene tetrahydromethanopterin reductase-like flavin-dependent oxidoreductase (luciferase family)
MREITKPRRREDVISGSSPSAPTKSTADGMGGRSNGNSRGTSSLATRSFSGQRGLARATEFYAKIKGRAAAAGREPGSPKVFPALSVITAETEAAAQAKRDALRALMPPQVALAHLAYLLGGFDLTSYPLDGPLPESNQSTSTQAEIYRRGAGPDDSRARRRDQRRHEHPRRYPGADRRPHRAVVHRACGRRLHGGLPVPARHAGRLRGAGASRPARPWTVS